MTARLPRTLVERALSAAPREFFLYDAAGNAKVQYGGDAIQYDPERASAMLDELGYVDVTGDGLRETPEGTAWSVPLAVSSSDEYMRIAQVIDAIEGVDPYEAASRVNELTTRLETSYTLTARLQDLSLVRYLG